MLDIGDYLLGRGVGADVHVLAASMSGGGARPVVRIIVDTPGGITIDEIADLTRTGRKEIARNYNTLKKNIVRLKKMRPPSPEQYLDRYIGALSLSIKVRNRASVLMKDCFEGGMNQGRNPIGIVAACIYIACVECSERRTQRQIARELEITEVTIRNRYKEAMAILEKN